MTRENYHQALLAEPWPPPDPVYEKAFRAWLRYYVRTEEYDRGLPGYWFRPDEWIPRGDYMYLSRAFAQELRKRVLFDLRAEPKDIVEKARTRAGELSHAKQRELLRYWETP